MEPNDLYYGLFSELGAFGYAIVFVSLFLVAFAFRWVVRVPSREATLFYFVLSLAPLVLGAGRTALLHSYVWEPGGLTESTLEERYTSAIFSTYLGAASTALGLLAFLCILVRRLYAGSDCHTPIHKLGVLLRHVPRALISWRTFAAAIVVHLLFCGCRLWFTGTHGTVPFALTFLFAPHFIIYFFFDRLYFEFDWVWDGPSPLIPWPTFEFWWYLLEPIPASYAYGVAFTLLLRYRTTISQVA